MPASNRTKSERRKMVWKKSGGRCAHCGRLASSRTQTVDHFIAHVVGGRGDVRNLMPLCKECNQARGSEEINDPETYYVYASPWAIEDLFSYERDWKSMHVSMKEPLESGAVYK